MKQEYSKCEEIVNSFCMEMLHFNAFNLHFNVTVYIRFVLGMIYVKKKKKL